MAIQEGIPENDPARSELVSLALELGRIPSLGVRTIIDALIQKSFSESGIFDNEFLELFEAAEIAETLADNFIDPLGRNSSRVIDKNSEELRDARAELDQYLDNYHKGILPTLFQKCQELNDKYGVTVDKLFSVYLRNKLVQKINQAAAHLAEKRFGEILKTNPDFYEKFLFPRIVNLNGGQISLNEERLKRAIYFLAKHGELNENTLFARLHNWINSQPVADRIAAVRADIVEQEPAAISGDGYQNGNFDRLFRLKIAPLISEQRDRGYGADVGLDDVIKINFGAMSQVIPGSKSAEAIGKIFDNEKDTDSTSITIEHFFSLEPGESIESLKPDLEMAKKQIKWTFKEVLEGNFAPDDPIRAEYKFIDEIMKCTDVRTLVQWITNPVDFLQSLDYDRQRDLIKEYGKLNIGAVISHESRKIMEFMMLYRKCAFYPQVKSRKKNKGYLSSFLTRRLAMTRQQHVKKTFHIKENARSKEKRRFEVIPNDDLDEDYSKMVEPLSAEKTDTALNGYEAWGEYIRIHPVESKRFIETSITIPGPNGTTEVIQIYVYAGDKDGLMHDKNIHSIVSNFLREGDEHPDFTDLVRWTIIPKNPYDYEKVTNYFVVNHMTDGKYRHTFSADGSGFSSRSLFPPHDREIISGFADIKAGENDDSKTRINFETQIARFLEDFIMYSLSDYTDSSHPKFSILRESPVIDQILHPPAIYGVKALKARERVPLLKDRPL